MTCKYCNNKLEDDAIVCYNCGRPAEGVEDVLIREHNINDSNLENETKEEVEILGMTETMMTIGPLVNNNNDNLGQINKGASMDITGSIKTVEPLVKSDDKKEIKQQNNTKTFIFIAVTVVIILLAVLIYAVFFR